MQQLDLDFQPGAPADHKKSSKASYTAARMIAILARRGTWATRAHLAEYGLTDRDCRAGRRASHGRILYGQRGYILMRDAKPDEISACLAATISMIRELQDEHRWTARRAHGVLTGRESVK